MDGQQQQDASAAAAAEVVGGVGGGASDDTYSSQHYLGTGRLRRRPRPLPSPARLYGERGYVGSWVGGWVGGWDVLDVSLLTHTYALVILPIYRLSTARLPLLPPLFPPQNSSIFPLSSPKEEEGGWMEEEEEGGLTDHSADCSSDEGEEEEEEEEDDDEPLLLLHLTEAHEEEEEEEEEEEVLMQRPDGSLLLLSDSRFTAPGYKRAVQGSSMPYVTHPPTHPPTSFLAPTTLPAVLDYKEEAVVLTEVSRWVGRWVDDLFFHVA